MAPPGIRNIGLGLCILLGLSLGGLHAAPPRAFPEHILRGANFGISGGYPGRYAPEDVSFFADSWKGNAVRVLINDIVPSVWPYKPDEQTVQDVFRTIDLCLAQGLYTIFSTSTSFDNNDNFFSNTALRAAYLDFWKQVAARYAASGPFAYDILNEPHDNLADSQWTPYAVTLTAAIRSLDSVHTIIVEPPGWGWPDGFDNLKPTGDKNTVYSFHFYGPMDFTHQRSGGQMMATTEAQWKSRVYPGTIEGEYWDKARLRDSIRKAVQFRDRNRVKIFCGEFGVARWAMGAEDWARDFIDALEEEHIGWAYYAYREWQHMDIEMDPAERVNPTARGETTPLVRLFKGYFARNTVPCDFNGDNLQDSRDALDLLLYLRKNLGGLKADFNRDGKSDIRDALSLLLARLHGGCPPE